MPILRTTTSALALLLSAVACNPDGSGGPGDGDAARASTETTRAPAESHRLAPMPSPRRTEVVGAYWDGKVVTVGGLLSDSSPSAQVDLYDPATDSWRRGPDLPVPVHHAGAGVLGGRLFVVGGYTGPAGPAWHPIADVHSLGPGEAAWRKEPPLEAPRGALAVASLPDALVVMGGTGDDGDDGALRRTEILEQGAADWRPGPDLVNAREHLAATAAPGPDGTVLAYAIAGRVGSLESNRASVESLALAGRAWTTEADLNHTRGGIGAATVAGAPSSGAPSRGERDAWPCVAGGEEPGGKTIAPVECLIDGRWEVVAHLAVPRHGLAVVAAGRRLHVIGGGPQAGLFVSDEHEAFDL